MTLNTFIKYQLESLQTQVHQISPKLKSKAVPEESQQLQIESLENLFQENQQLIDKLQNASLATTDPQSNIALACKSLIQAIQFLEEELTQKKLSEELREIRLKISDFSEEIYQSLLKEEHAANEYLKASQEMLAKDHFQKAIEMIYFYPEILRQERKFLQKEFEISLQLGSLLIKHLGYTNPEVQKVYSRAEEICWKIEELPKLYQVFRGFWIHYILQAKMVESLQIAKHILKLAEKQNDPVMLIDANMALGQACCYMGQWKNTYFYFDRTIKLYNQDEEGFQKKFTMENPKISAYASYGLGYFFQGRIKEGLVYAEESICLARKINDIYTLVLCLSWLGGSYVLLRNKSQAIPYFEEALKLCKENNFDHWTYVIRGQIGCALTEEEATREEGIKYIQETLNYFQETKVRLAIPFYWLYLARAYKMLGFYNEAFSGVEKELNLILKEGQDLYKAALLGLKGEILSCLSNSSVKESEKCFQEGLELAQEQEIKMIELRISIAYSRFKFNKGEAHEAEKLLEKIIQWFPTELKTKDLEEAHSLLEEIKRITSYQSTKKRAKKQF